MTARAAQCTNNANANANANATSGGGASGGGASRGSMHTAVAAPARRVEGEPQQQCRCRFVSPCRLGTLCSAPKPHGLCDAYRRVDFAAELPDVARDTRWVAPDDYFALAMRHRFCVAAPGDYWSTTKLSDAMAAGGAGGCVPLIVLPRSREAEAAAALPYASTVDYCRVAYLVTYHGPDADGRSRRGVRGLSEEEGVEAGGAARGARALFGAAAQAPLATAARFTVGNRTRPVTTPSSAVEWMLRRRAASRESRVTSYALRPRPRRMGRRGRRLCAARGSRHAPCRWGVSPRLTSCT